MGTEYSKHAAHSPFLPFKMPFVPQCYLFWFLYYSHFTCAKIKKQNSGAKVLFNLLLFRVRTFEASFQTATSSRRGMRAGVAQGGLTSPVLFNLYVNDMPSLSHHVELALYADDMAIIATSRKPTLLVSYLESYLNDLQRWLSEWRIAINVSKSRTIIFARARRRFIQPRPVTLFGEPIQWVETTRYLGVTLDKRLTSSPHIDRVGNNAQRMGMLGPLLNRKSDLSVRKEVLLYKEIIRPVMDYAYAAWRTAAHIHVRRLHTLQSKCLHLAMVPPGT